MKDCPTKRVCIYCALTVLGTALGFLLSRMGFSNYNEVHAMFTFGHFRLLLAFVGGLILSAIMYLALRKNRWLPTAPIHRGSVLGGIIFGLGWAITGACPAVVLVQIGEGVLPAFLSLIGLLFGVWFYSFMHKHVLKWDRHTCGK